MTQPYCAQPNYFGRTFSWAECWLGFLPNTFRVRSITIIKGGLRDFSLFWAFIFLDNGDGPDDISDQNEGLLFVLITIDHLAQLLFTGFITRCMKFASPTEDSPSLVHSKGLLFHDLRYLEHPLPNGALAKPKEFQFIFIFLVKTFKLQFSSSRQMTNWFFKQRTTRLNIFWS